MKLWTKAELLEEMEGIFADAASLVGGGHPVTFEYEKQRIEDACVVVRLLLGHYLAAEALEDALAHARKEREADPKREAEPTAEDFAEWDRK